MKKILLAAALTLTASTFAQTPAMPAHAPTAPAPTKESEDAARAKAIAASKPAAAAAATAQQAANDYSTAIANLEHQIEDTTKDLQINYMALSNLVEFQNYLGDQQRGNALTQQLNNLKAQQTATASKPK